MDNNASREAFEKFAVDKGWWLSKNWAGSYLNNATNDFWETWQEASRQQQAADVVVKYLAECDAHMETKAALIKALDQIHGRPEHHCDATWEDMAMLKQENRALKALTHQPADARGDVVERVAKAMQEVDGDFPMVIDEYLPYAKAAISALSPDAERVRELEEAHEASKEWLYMRKEEIQALQARIRELEEIKLSSADSKLFAEAIAGQTKPALSEDEAVEALLDGYQSKMRDDITHKIRMNTAYRALIKAQATT